MFGAVISDLIGSPYLYQNTETENTDFSLVPLISEESKPTEITIMTLAVAEAIMHAMPTQVDICTGSVLYTRLFFWMKKFGRKFKDIRYGRKFHAWLSVRKSFAYESTSSGAVSRVSPVAWAFDNLYDVERFAEIVTKVTTKTPETVIFTQTMAGMIFLARTKKDKDEIKNYFQERTGVTLLPTVEELRQDIEALNTCKGATIAALVMFLEGENFEDIVRSALSLGVGSTAVISMAGALAEAFYGVRILTEVEAFERLCRRLQFTIEKWEQWKN